MQDRKIAHCPFHMLMPAERETFLARKKLLEYMGLQLRQAVFAKESQWDLKVLHLSKRGGCGGRSGRVVTWVWWAASGVGSCSGLLRQLRAEVVFDNIINFSLRDCSFDSVFIAHSRNIFSE